MRKQLLSSFALFGLLFLSGITGYAQLTGTKTIPGDYATIALAITDLNTQGVGAGGVIFNISQGYTETITAPLSVTATGTSANPIIFQKSGSGANPLITAYVGTATPISVIQDGLWNLVGSDYVTIDGISLTDPNTTNPASMEYGFGFFKASVTNGCQYNTIKNCAVTLNRVNNASATAPAVEGSRAINVMNSLLTTQTTAVTLTSASGTNSYNKFYSNTLQNCNYGIALIGYAGTTPFTLCDYGNDVGGSTLATGNTIINYGGAAAATNPAAGVRTLAQYDLNISYNTINNNNGTGVNHASTLRGIYLNTATSASATVNNNTVTINSGSTTSQVSVIENASGSTASGNTINISNNSIQNCTWTTATTGTFYGIYNSASPATTTISGNTISTFTLPNTGTAYMIYTGSPTNLNVFNNEVGYITKSVSGTLYAIYGGTSVMNVHDNNVHHLTMSAGGNAVYGFYDLSSPVNESYYNNTFNNFANAGTGGLFGIYTNTAAGVRNVYSNTIFNFSASGGGPIYGIYGAASSPNIYKNKLYNLSSGTTAGQIFGIYFVSGTTANIYNNFVSDLKTPASTLTDAIRGIYISGGTTANVFYNTVYMNASSTSATTFGTTGIYKSSTTTGDFRNNIIINVSTPGPTGGLTVAYRWSAVYNATYYAATSNANNFYAGTPSASAVIFNDGTNSLQTIAAYKAFVTGREGLSFSENTALVNTITAPFDLHINPAIATQCESGALPVTSPIAITDDIDGNTRNVSSPDVGADEGTFTLLDLASPVIAYSPLTSTSSLAARTITATITDVSGVGTGANQPVMYWAINAGAYTGPVAPTSTVGSQYTFTLGGGVILGDVVKYYFVAQDQAPASNIASSPVGATVTANPPLASAPPATPNSYTILACISGSKTVGLIGDYTTITAALADLNSKELCGPFTLQLLDAAYPSETFPLSINFNSGSSAVNKVTIKPASGVTTSISGASATGAIFKIQNSNTLIDGSNSGGTSRDLTITNTSATSPSVVVLYSTGTTPISGVTVKNTIMINGVNTSTALMVSDVAGTSGYFNNITIQNNSVQKAYNGIFCLATTAAGNGNGLLITGNDLNTSGANALLGNGIYVQGADGVTVSNNNIGNTTQSAYTFSPTGIWFSTDTKNATISGNTITNMAYTGTSAYSARGIVISNTVLNSNISITNNTVSGMSTSGSTQPYGIYIFTASSGITVDRNKVSSIYNSNTGGYGARGIHVNTGIVSSNITLKNNFVWDVKATSDATVAYWGIGIGIEGATGGVNVYSNSVNLYGSYAGYTTATVSAAFAIITSTASAIDVRDNIFVNTFDNTNGASDKSYAINTQTSNTAFTDINYNDYYVSGTPGTLGYLGADVTSLASWQAATVKDANSISGDPLFVSSTDLHLNTALSSPAKNAGYTLPSVTTDIDGDTRNNPPDMGADDYSLVPVVTTIAATS
ncbi:MAG: right-handed parallel beta-helix repeat-containing protein, partial [Bacteroidota bacterium]